MGLTALQMMLPESMWSAQMKVQAMQDAPALFQSYNTLERSWARLRNMMEERDVPAMTPDQLAAFQKSEQLQTTMKPGLDQMLQIMRDTARSQIAAGRLSQEQVNTGGLAALPLLAAGLLISLAAVVPLGLYAIYRATAGMQAQAEGARQINDATATAWLAYWASHPDQPPITPQLPGGSSGGGAGGVFTGIGLIVAAVAALFIFGGRAGGRRA